MHPPMRCSRSKPVQMLRCGAVLGACVWVLTTAPAAADPPWPDPAPAVYKPAYEYPVLDEIRASREARQAQRDSLRRMVDRRYQEEDERKKEERHELRIDWTGIDRPESPDAFAAAVHLPPAPQYATGTCWAFSSTSFFESEVYRLTGRRIKLSEMWTVYWEYVEKARRFVREYGHSNLGQGSQDLATQDIYRLYGAVPAAAYAGQRDEGLRYDHAELSGEIKEFLAWVDENDVWDEERVLGYVRGILEAHMAPPPETFAFEGRRYTPPEFLDQVLRLRLDDYVPLLSTMAEPFGQRILFDVHDNWRRRDDYLNVPLEDFYDVIKSSVRAGYTVALGGDVSEPGLDGMQDAAIIPPWDISAEAIDQSSRELRIYNKTTTDDHGVHVVGYCLHDGRDWFLIKDSNRSSRLGRFKGYYFYSGDYIRLKMLSALVHRDRVTHLLGG